MDYKQKYLKYKNKYLKLKQIAGSKIPSEQVTHKVLKGHTSDVNSVAFNHDGTKIVSGSDDNTIRVWNVDTGESILTLKGHTSEVYSVGFNHDGTKIVSGSFDETIRVWNVDVKSDNYGECILTLKDQWLYSVRSVGFNHDGTKIVSKSSTEDLRVWNVNTGESILTLKGHRRTVRSVGFNHDGTKIVSGSFDRTIRVWNVDVKSDNYGQCILTLKGHTNGVYSVGFNHDGTKIVSGSGDQTIRVWNVDTGECILTLKGHTSGVFSVGFNHDGTKIVSGSGDKTIRVWNVDEKSDNYGQCILILKGQDNVYSVGFNHDGTKIVSGSWDRTIRVWDIDVLAKKFPFMKERSIYEKYMTKNENKLFLVVDIVIPSYSLILKVTTNSEGKYRVEREGGRGDNKLESMIGSELCEKIKNQQHTNIKELIEDIYTGQLVKLQAEEQLEYNKYNKK